MAAHQTLFFRQGSIVIRQGEEANGLFLVRRGALSIHVTPQIDQPTEEEIRNASVQVGEVGEGGIIGETGLFFRRRTASVLAAVDTTLEYIPLEKEGFEETLCDHVDLGWTLCRSLAQRLRDTTGKIREIHTAAETIDRAWHRFAVEFALLVDQAKGFAKTYPSLSVAILDAFHSEFYRTGARLLQQQRQTGFILEETVGTHLRGHRTLSPGEVLCREGEVGNAIYFVKEGELAVPLRGMVIAKIGKGEFAGELAILFDSLSPRTATLIAECPSQIMAFERKTFRSLAEKYPRLLLALATTLARRLEITNRLVGTRLSDSHNILDRLSGSEESAQAHFHRLSEALLPLPATSHLGTHAARFAQELAHLYEELLPPEMSSPDLPLW